MTRAQPPRLACRCSRLVSWRLRCSIVHSGRWCCLNSKYLLSPILYHGQRSFVRWFDDEERAYVDTQKTAARQNDSGLTTPPPPLAESQPNFENLMQSIHHSILVIEWILTRIGIVSDMDANSLPTRAHREDVCCVLHPGTRYGCLPACLMKRKRNWINYFISDTVPSAILISRPLSLFEISVGTSKTIRAFLLRNQRCANFTE